MFGSLAARQPGRLIAAASAVSVVLCLSTSAGAVPDITTEEILDKMRHAPGASTTVARVPGSREEVGTMGVGAGPEGYGPWIDWNREAPGLLFVAFINAADTMGLAITNVKKGDVIRFESVAGLASFSEGNGKAISGAITVASLLGQGGVIISGNAEIAPIIRAGEKYATKQFGKPTEGKVRDGFGSSGKYLRRCEGGVLVTFPSAGGVYYSGKGRRCVLGRDDANGRRTDDRIPPHIGKNGYFLVREMWANERVIPSDGVLSMVAWDRPGKFGDNKGYYRVIFKLIRGDSVNPPAIEQD